MINLSGDNKVLLNFAKEFQAHRQDLSAVILTPDQYLWLGSDETSTLERLSFIDGNNFGEHQHYRVAEFIDLPAPEDEEIDIEGLAFHDHYLWFNGSHSYKRKKVKPDKSSAKNIQRLATIATEPNRYILGRIPLVNGQLSQSCPHPENPNLQLTAAKLQLSPRGNILMDALVDDPHLGAFINAKIPGKDNGFDVEGIAVYQNRVFLGLRGPVLRGWAVMLEIELAESSPGLMNLQPIGANFQLYKKHFIFLNGLGIRDLYQDGEDLLILAGPTMDLDGPVQIYRLHGGAVLQQEVITQPEYIMDIPYGNRDDHAEGITMFQDICGKPSVLVVYDSPNNNRLVGDGGVIADVIRLR
ncbi:MAG: DUF3616 domain-containing protein [Nostocaceae cyanobacterium]|nr:DUF3616 domain-containing protein [Nostocaceae cyanobacterium]